MVAGFSKMLVVFLFLNKVLFPDDDTLNSAHCENLKSYRKQIYFHNIYFLPFRMLCCASIHITHFKQKRD